jgi:hypothetical protein
MSGSSYAEFFLDFVKRGLGLAVYLTIMKQLHRPDKKVGSKGMSLLRINRKESTEIQSAIGALPTMRQTAYEYIETGYNRDSSHSTNDFLSSMKFKTQFHQFLSS